MVSMLAPGTDPPSVIPLNKYKSRSETQTEASLLKFLLETRNKFSPQTQNLISSCFLNPEPTHALLVFSTRSPDLFFFFKGF